MTNFFKWLSALAAGNFTGFILMCVISVINACGGEVNIQWAYVGAIVAMLLVLWDCYKLDFNCWKEGND